jgi:Uma2 family endonuclease
VVVAASEHECFSIRYAVPRWSPSWAVPEVPVPESKLHDQAIEYLRALLLAWAERSGRHVDVLRNLGIRWVRSEPRAGFDPDLCLVDPAPNPEGELASLRLWEAGIAVPRLAIEIVSPGHPYKDYIDAPERAAACGIGELWVYDPLLAGPKKHGGPFPLQIWRREGQSFERVHAGPGPAHSPELDAWLHPSTTRRADNASLRISDDAEGERPWATQRDQAIHDAERQRKRAEAAEHELEQQATTLSAAVIDVLEARGIGLTGTQRERILGCTEPGTLGRWLRRAATVATTDALFE